MDTVTITSGKFKGRKIATPGGATHPMGSRERLALFNILGVRIRGVNVLDAFAGSGSLGIEALSREAKTVIFVDKSAKSTEVIKGNLAKLGIFEDAKVIRGSASSVAGRIGLSDIILADPPYDDFELSEVEPLVNVLKTGGILALSHPGEAPKITGMRLFESRQYAGACISFYIKN